MTKAFVSTQAYPFMQRAQEEGRDWADSLDWALAQVAEAGLQGWEPIVRTPEQVDVVGAAAARHGLSMPSLYVGGAMHEPLEGSNTAEIMAGVAERAADQGVRFVVINPNPIDWKSKDNKSDAQLRYQARSLQVLGERFLRLDVQLCYHTHDAEMRASAREFHHMLTATTPEAVRLCLDPHWIYRGAENSAVALHDIITHYGRRVELVHLRQSQSGVWDETVGEGDLDYSVLAQRLLALGLDPLLVIERALEPGTPKTMSDAEAHRRSAIYAKQTFGSQGLSLSGSAGPAA